MTTFTLRRGGKELTVTQLEDRFRVRLIPEEPVTLQEVAASVGGTVGDAEVGEILFGSPCDPQNLQQAIDAARRNAGVRYASHVYEYTGGRLYLNEQLTIVYHAGTTAAGREQIMEQFDLVVETPLEGVESTYKYEISMSSTRNPIQLTNELYSCSEVIEAEPNLETFVSKEVVSPDPKFSQSWHQQVVNMTDVAANSNIQVDQAWEVTKGDRSIRVAVIDDGFDLGHPDLKGVNKIISPLNMRPSEQGLAPLPSSANDSHGTPCAGVILAEENTLGAVGIAPGCTLIPIKSSGYISDEYIEKIFNHARLNNAAVVSCSWTAGMRDFPLSIRMKNAIARCAKESRGGKGAVILFSAGNRNRPINGTVNESGWSPDSFISGQTFWRNGFGEHPDVLCIASITSMNKKALYSSWGKEIAVCAPSGDTVAYWQGQMPNPDAAYKRQRGVGVIAPDVRGFDGYDTADYTLFSGTSCACPVAAGVAALVISANPNLTAAQVRQIIKDTADKIVDSSTCPQLGTAKGNYTNGHSEWMGYGRVNAKKAVDAAIALLPPAAFTDTKGHWAAPFIEPAKTNGWTSGYADGTFKPNGYLNRSAFAALLYAAFPDRPLVRPSAAFSDVPANHWAYTAIDFAYRTGFMSGYTDGTFKPDSAVTKLQALVAINNGLGLTGGDSTLLNKYDDKAAIPAWAYTAIASATFNKLVVNYPSPGWLRPNDQAYRCEVVAFIVQAKVKLGAIPPVQHNFIVV